MAKKIGSLFWEITADSSNFQKGLTDSKSKMSQFKSGLNDVVQGLTGFSLGQASVTAAIIATGNAVKDAVVSYSAYAEQVAILAGATGQTAEETSRLIQVADDFRVTTDQLESSMRIALQNGFVPTIENLAVMSDRYLSMTDATERAKLMQDTFGRSWMDLIPLLEAGGEAIRNNSASIDDSLIVTDAATRKNREYMRAMDDFNDSVEGVKMNIGGGLIPVITVLLDSLNRTQDSIDKSKAGWLAYVPVLGTVYQAALGLNALFASILEKIGAVGAYVPSQYDTSGGAYNDAGAGGSRTRGGGTSQNDPDFRRANGGYVAANTAYTVGERGPEMFVPKQDGVIIPNEEMGALAPVTINIYGITDPKKVAEAVAVELRRARRN